MSETPPPIPQAGSPRDPATQKGNPSAPEPADAKYNRIADTVGLIPNVRKKDNLYQGVAVLAFVIIGMIIGWLWNGSQIRDVIGDGLVIRVVIGALVGLVVGALLSGLVIMVLGFIRKS